jgi:hypothetical protein
VAQGGPESDSVAFGENGEIVEIPEIAHPSVGTYSLDFTTLQVACGLLF